MFVCDDNSVQWGKWRHPLKRVSSFNVGERLASRPVGLVVVRDTEAWVLDEDGVVTKIIATNEDENPSSHWKPYKQ